MTKNKLKPFHLTIDHGYIEFSFPNTNIRQARRSEKDETAFIGVESGVMQKKVKPRNTTVG